MVPVEQMDNAIRPYFIHHRNQVGINTSLMDLFRLIDLFLREDEEAREPLQALRIISDYVQRKHIVAPMPSELVNFYDDPHTAAESVATGQNPLAELSRLLAPLTASTAYPTRTTRKARAPHSTMGVSAGLNPSQDEREPVFHVPLGMSSPSRPTRVDLSLAFGNMPVPNLYQDQVLPLRATSTMAATDHRSTLVVDVIREKLRSWLRRPDTGALKKWVLKKRQRFPTEDESWQFVNEYSADLRAGVQAMEGNPETSSISAARFEPIPVTFPHGGVQITRDIVMHSDALSSERRRSISISMARPLPPAPSQGESREASSNSGELSSTTGHARSQSAPVNVIRTQRNPSAAPIQGSNSDSGAGSSILQSVPTVVAPPRVHRASLRERAASALFSTKSDSSSTDPSLQAHLQAQLYSARFVAGISMPRPVLVPQPILTPRSTTSVPRKAEGIPPPPKRVLPPQIRLEMGQNPDLPSIVIQPPSRPQTLSTPSLVADPINASTSSSEPVYHSLSSSSHSPRATPDAKLFRNSTYYADPHSGPTNDAENSSPLQRRGSHRTNAESRRGEMYESINPSHYTANTVGDDQEENGVSSLDSEEEYQSTTHSIHHGLPTPKSVVRGGKLPATTPVVSLHENTSTRHHLQASGLTEATSTTYFQKGIFDSREDTRNIGPDGRAAPLVSRFSLDSHFTVSSRSTQGHPASLYSESHSLSEATSHEGEFLAQLASRRKRAIRSGTSRPTRRTPSLLVSPHTVPEESPITQNSPTRVKERNGSSPLGVGESSRSPWTTHRSSLPH